MKSRDRACQSHERTESSGVRFEIPTNQARRSWQWSCSTADGRSVAIWEVHMPRVERIREVLTGALTPAYLDQKAREGWEPVVVVWERTVEGGKPESANITEQVPYGLKISEDCLQLEQDI